MTLNNQPSNSRVALITGASRGLGSVLAAFLAGQGYNLVLTARGQNTLIDTAENLKPYGVTIISLAGDVNAPAHRKQLIGTAQSLGRLDVLINNASNLGLSPMPELADYPLEILQQVFATNVLAPLGLIQEALPLLRTSHGLIINITSDAARGGYSGWGGYGASKAALDLVTKTLAEELSDDGIGVVSVDPGDMRTDMHQHAFPGEDISDRPLPDVTLPFWAWLLNQEHIAVSGGRYEAQAEQWETIA
jgi:NAD(P)-dependent dehydrogenase (short-subunit alcohol dehydrogenase family)